MLLARLKSQRSPSCKKEAYRPLGDTARLDLFPPVLVRRFPLPLAKEICHRSPERKYIRSAALGAQTNILTPPLPSTSEVIRRSPDPSPLTAHISRRVNPESFQRNASCWLSADHKGEDGDVPAIDGFDRMRSILSPDPLLAKVFFSWDC